MILIIYEGGTELGRVTEEGVQTDNADLRNALKAPVWVNGFSKNGIYVTEVVKVSPGHPKWLVAVRDAAIRSGYRVAVE
jgi:hypothetical protein